MPQLNSLNSTEIASFDLQENQQPNPCMRLAQLGGGHYLVPLTGKPPLHWITHSIKDPKPERLAVPNVFMPVRLLRLKADGSTEPLRPGTWLYVFQNGYLWREIRMPSGRQLYQLDVNLIEHAGQDQRPARCLGSEHLLLAYRVNGLSPEYRLAYSETQWSWAQIQALGGLHPEDPRNSSSTDLQTPDTLAALEQRTCLLPLTDADILSCRVQTLSGPSQTEVAAEPQVDPEDLTLPHLLITDPLQDARDLKAKQDELIALQAAGLQSLQTGQLGLARMIRDLTENGDPLKLEQHLDDKRHDRSQLETWEKIDQQLPDLLEAAERPLLEHLQAPAFTLALADYLQSDDLFSNECGLCTLSQLIEHLTLPESLIWLHTILDEQQAASHPVYGPARGEKERLNARLVQRTNNRDLPLPNEDDDSLQGLDLADRLALITLLPFTLDTLIGKYAEAASRHHGAQVSDLLATLARRFEKLTNTELKQVRVSLRSWMGTANRTVRGTYSYLPESLTRAIHKIGNQTVLQLIPKDMSFDELVRAMDNSGKWQRTSLSVLGSLMLVNAGLAVHKAWETDWQDSEKKLSAITATTSFIAFVMEKVQKLTPEPKAVEAKPQTLRNVTSTQQKNLVSRFSRFKLVHTLAYTVTYRLLAIAAGVMETSLSIWRATRGYQTGNIGVMIGAGLEAIGSTLLLISILIIFNLLAGPILWTALLGLAFFASGSLLRIFSQHSPLEQIVRHGWFGSHPYKNSDLSFQQPEDFDLRHMPAYFYRLALTQIENGGAIIWNSLRQPDLSGELQAITKTLFHFTAEIKVHELHDDSYILPKGQVIPRPDHAIVELYITLGAFTPINTRLQGYIQLGGRQILLDDCYVIELRDTTTAGSLNTLPQYLRFLTQIPRNAISRGIRATAWLDPDGTGQLQVPDERPSYRWLFINNVPFSFPPRNNLGHITRSEWQRLRQLATQLPVNQPANLLVDRPENCQYVTRNEAQILPLFATALPGGS